MEAVSRMSMLSLELKESAERVEFGPVIKPYISQHYMEDDNKYTEEIRQIDQLRINACNVTRDFNGISVLKKYYGQLHLLTSRFPMGEGGAAALPFTWMDTFDEEPFTHIDVAYEQACILYNLGSLHSILGAKESRSSEEEMKVACTHFQCAAGAFTYLRDHFQSDMSPDISFELMTIYINVMLGQAQECLLEKSMQDNRKSSLVARISIQVVDYYRQAMRGLDDSNVSSLLGSKKSKTWKKVLTIKMNHFISVAYMFMSNQAEEQQKYGERVAYLQFAVDKHNEAVKMSKGQHETIVDALNFTKDVVVGKFQSAKKDNDFIYHDTVPAIENLPEIKGASLVKALTFQPYDESVAGLDVFRKLVPMEAHEASSLYSEEKAKLLRKMSTAVEDKNKQLDQFMSALGVEQLNLQKQEPERLPQVLLEVCAAISVKEDPIKTLVTSMQALSNVVLDVDLAVKELAGVLEEEDKQEQEFQSEFGSRPTNILKDLKKEFGKYQEGHAKASRSNQELHKAMAAHIGNIRSLAGPLEDLQALLPSNKDAEKPEDKEAHSKLQKLLDKVEEMKNQRQTLEGQLREHLQNDDITSQIVTKEGGNMKDFFEEELKKHSTICTYIDQNLAAQDNILKAVTDANAAYADTRKMSSDTAKQREEKIQELITSYTVYDDLIAKSHKGTEFYKKLEQGITKLLSKAKGVVKVNQEEREAMIQKIRPKLAPARPTAPKPPTPMDDAPRGPRLSDFWQPKTRGAPATSTQPSSPQPGMRPDLYPNAAVTAAAAAAAAGQAAAASGQMYPGMPGPTVSGGVPGGAMPRSIPNSNMAPGVNTMAGHMGQTGPQHMGVASAPMPRGGESHPGAPGGQQEVRPMSTPDGSVPTGMQHGKGGHGSPSHPPGGIPHQSPVHTSVASHPGMGQHMPINPSQPMSPVLSQPPNLSQPTHSVMTHPSSQSQPSQGVMSPSGSQLQLSQGIVSPPSSQQQRVPPSSMNQPPSSIYQQGNVSTGHPQQAGTSNMQAYPTNPGQVTGLPSAGYIPSSVPSGPNQRLPAASSSGHMPSVSGAPPPNANHPYPHPQSQQTQLPQQPPTAAVQQRFVAPQQSGQWQQQPMSQPTYTPHQPSSLPPNLGYGTQPNQSHAQTSMTMVSSNTTPIATPVQQNTGQRHYPQGQFPPTSVQGMYQPGQPGMQYQTGMGQVRPNMPPPQQQQPFTQQPQQYRQPHPVQQQMPTQQQQTQIRMPQPGVGIQQQQPGIQQHQQPGLQQQKGMQQQPGVPQLPHGQQQQQPRMQQPQAAPAFQQNQQQQNQPHVYHQHTGQQHPHVYQQPPGSPQRQPTPQPQLQQTQSYGQNVQQPQGTNMPVVSTGQHQQVPAGTYQQQQVGMQPAQQQQQIGMPPVRQQQQGPNVPGGPISQQQQVPMGNYHSQQQVRPVQPQQQYVQPQRPAQPGSPLPQQQASPQHRPNIQPQVGQNVAHQPPQRTGSLDQNQQPFSHQPPQRTGSLDQTQHPFSHQQPALQQQQPRPQLGSGSGPQGYPGGPGNVPPNQIVPNQHVPPIQQNQPGISGPQQHQQYTVPGGPGSPQRFSGQQQPANTGQMNQQPMMGQVRAPAPSLQGVQGQNMPQQKQFTPVNQPQMGQQTFQPGGPIPQQPHPNQVPHNQQQQQQPHPNQVPLNQQQQQQPHPNQVPLNQQQQQQQYNFQQPPGAPLTKSQQNQKINQAFKEEQQKLPLPSLQPTKVEAKPNDLLSASPDSQQKSLSDVQLLQPQATSTTADQSSTSSTPADTSPQQQTCTSPPTIQSGPTTQTGQRTEAIPRQNQPLPNEGTNSSGPKYPYDDKESLDKFVEDVERFEKAVEGLSKQMLSGPTVLEKIWKELTDAQDRDTRQYSMAVARLYSMKNRQSDIMPYDHNRVVLSNAKNDYINASYIKDLSASTPQFIATQAPVAAAINDFWLMVYEQQITIIAALMSQPPGGGKSADFDQYWLEERGQVQTYGPIMLTMQSKRNTDFHTERIFNLMHKETRQMRTLFLLQFTAWPEFGVPSNPAAFIQFIGEVNSYHKQQRRLQTPVLVHCKSGVSRTSAFCVIYTAIQEMQAGNGIIDIPQVVKALRQQRKWMITEKEQLKFCYDAILVCAHQMLAKRGLLTHNSLVSPAYDSKRAPSRINSFDFIMGNDSVESLHTRISQMTVRPLPEPAPATAEGEPLIAGIQPEFGQEDLSADISAIQNVSDSAPQMHNEQVQPPLSPMDHSGSTGQPANVGLLDLQLGSEQISGFQPAISPGLISPDGSSSSSLSQLQENNLNFFSQSAQNFIPDVVESNTATPQDSAGGSGSGTGSEVMGSNSSLPSILADLTPQNFSIKDQPPSKQKATKADFMSGKRKLGEQGSVDDPLSMLDPMWTVHKAKPSQS